MRSLTRILGRAVALVALAVMASSTAAYAQYETYMELLREDIKTEKVAIITEAMQFTDDQSTVFWPIYREYDLELSKLVDQRIALIKDFAASYTTMTDDTAKELADRSFKIRANRAKLLKKYYGKVEKQLGAAMAVRWAQTERVINTLIDLQVQSQLPLMPKGGSGKN